MNLTWLKGLIDQLVAFLLRPRHLGVKLLSVSTTVLIALAGGFAFELKGFAGVVDTLKFSSGEGLPGHIVALVAYLACITWVLGVGMMVLSYRREWHEADARRVLVVELRGLVDTSDRPLLAAVPLTVPGRRIDCLVDVRQLLSAKPPQVQEALQELGHIRRQLRLQRGATAKESVAVVAGGVMQVPLQFYAGTLIDDEGAVQLYDWERTEKRWKALSEMDDESRFTVTGLNTVGGAPEVVLAVSASYRVAMDDIAATFPDHPLVHLARPNPTPNTLWSEANQAALTQQFLQTLAALANRGVETVHLILAAPASLSIRFGMAYDGRNMPQLRCYQREAGQYPPYPWSIRMPQGQRPVEYLLTPASRTSTALAA
jgi:hypothetical protein